MKTELTAFLDHLCDLDVVVAVDGDRLKIDAPQGAMTPDLRAALAERKATILDYLSRPRWRVDQDAEPLRIPLSLDKPPSEYLAERGLRIVGGDQNGRLYVADQEVAA